MNNALPLCSSQKLHGYGQMHVDKGYIYLSVNTDFPKGGFISDTRLRSLF